eukprot:GHVP01035021.1.p1 GENE.GHVP01035021.1~~GHVP01035021.1.p1  ORF type:complete len:250 (+),score=39.09 GHVP01035021.1:48-752(+)
MTFDTGIFKLSEELNTVFIKPLGLLADDEEELKQNFSATEISFQTFKRNYPFKTSSVAVKKPCGQSVDGEPHPEAKNCDANDASDTETDAEVIPPPKIHYDIKDRPYALMSKKVGDAIRDALKDDWQYRPEGLKSLPDETNKVTYFHVEKQTGHCNCYNVKWCGDLGHKKFMDCCSPYPESCGWLDLSLQEDDNLYSGLYAKKQDLFPNSEEKWTKIKEAIELEGLKKVVFACN